MLSCHRQDTLRIRIQLFLAVCHMHHGEDAEHHPLIPGGQVIQHLFGFLSLQFHIIRHNGRKVIVGILASLPVGHIGLHAKQTVLDLTHRFVCGYREDIDGQHQVPA